MKIEEIERVLVEFYEGRTTEEQEEMLRLFFEAEQVPVHLEADRRIFLSFRSPAEPEIPEGLEGKLIQRIDAERKKESAMIASGREYTIRRWWGGVAAAVLFCLAFGYGISLWQQGGRGPKDTFTDPKEAFTAIQLALIEVSSNLNSGLDQLAETRSEMKQISDEIREEIQ